jgi:hypothetical protein
MGTLNSRRNHHRSVRQSGLSALCIIDRWKILVSNSSRLWVTPCRPFSNRHDAYRIRWRLVVR